MTIDFISLAIIALVSAAVPIIARPIPNKAVPETVFLLIFGAVLGPAGAGIIHTDDVISFFGDMGMAFLFLLAGFEINPRNLVGNQGKHALLCWVFSFAAALGLSGAAGLFAQSTLDGFAVSIAVTTTALGTLLPILKERGLMGTPIGNTVIAYGTWGELCPVLAMALLLTSRAKLESTCVLLALVALCVLVAAFGRAVRKYSTKLFDFLVEGSQTTSQTYVRMTMLLLIGLLAFAAVFELDLVLGAFAAGFVLRFLVPEENTTLEMKLNGMAHGLFIPVFFVVSGCGVNLSAVAADPVMLLGFIGILVLVRAVPVFISVSLGRETRGMAPGSRISVALYCATALPLIVACTSVCVNAGTMSESVASVLVSAGAVTVFVMPLLAMCAQRVADAHPLQAVDEVAHDNKDFKSVVREHVALAELMSVERKEEQLEREGSVAARRARREARQQAHERMIKRREAKLERLRKRQEARLKQINEQDFSRAKSASRSDYGVSDCDNDGLKTNEN